MTQSVDDSKQIKSVLDHHYKPTQQENSALLNENGTEENDTRVHAYPYAGETQASRSSEHYRNEFVGSEGQCCYQSGEIKAEVPLDVPPSLFLPDMKDFSSECIRKVKLIHICLSVSVVVSVGLTFSIVFMATKFGKDAILEGENSPLLQLPKMPLQDTLSIPCDYLGSTIKAQDTLFDSVSLYGSKFCWVKNGSLQKLFLLMLQEGYTSIETKDRLELENYAVSNTTLSTWRSNNIAAHVYANVNSLPEKLTWESDIGFGTAFTHGIILTRDSSLLVPRAGFYYIYSAVTFKCQTKSTPYLVHGISRKHSGRPNAGVQHLLLSKTSKCGPGEVHTSFLAGVLKLTSNDQLSVNLTDYSLTCVYKATFSNYFGLYLI